MIKTYFIGYQDVDDFSSALARKVESIQSEGAKIIDVKLSSSACDKDCIFTALIIYETK